MKILLLALLVSSSLWAQDRLSKPEQIPTVIGFVAPAYPRAAKNQRMMGTSEFTITVGKDGHVRDVKTVHSHPVFESYVVAALKQWRFDQSADEHRFNVTFLFEFYDEDCEQPETSVSAELPTVVHIKTGLQCIQVSTNKTKPEPWHVFLPSCEAAVPCANCEVAKPCTNISMVQK